MTVPAIRNKRMIAVVGTSQTLSDENEILMRNIIVDTLDKLPRDNSIEMISGGAKGVDSMAVDIAKRLGFRTHVRYPEKQEWRYFKIRNLKIAKECDEILCFTLETKEQGCYHHKHTEKPHLRTGGCWTLEKVREMGKPVEIILI